MGESDEVDGWSEVAAAWQRSWGDVAGPARAALLDATGTGPGTRLLDVGCGSGELLAEAAARGAAVHGSDSAPGMLALARDLVPGAELVPRPAEDPWPGEAGFDVVTAVNVLHLTADPAAVLRGLAGLLRPGGHLAVAGWGASSGLGALDAALAELHDEDPVEPSPLSDEGAWEDLLGAAGTRVTAAGTVAVAWCPADDDDLLRGLLLVPDVDEVDPRTRAVVLRAGAPSADTRGGYRFPGGFRWAAGQRGSGSASHPSSR